MKALFIGLGSIGQRHLKNLICIDPEIEIIAFRQRNRPLSEELNYRIKSFTDLNQALSFKPDIAIISCPSKIQIDIAKKIIEANIPFLIEKPISNTLKGLDEVAKTIREKNIISFTAFNMRFHPCFKKTKELINENILGNIIHFYAQVGQFLPDWHPYEDYREGYSAKKSLGGGVSLDLIHELDYVTNLLGSPKKIYWMKSNLSSLEIETEDTSNYMLELSSGIMGMIHLDYVQRRGTRTLTIIGDVATMEVDFIYCNIKVFDQNNIILDYSNPEFERNDMYLEMISSFINSIKENKYCDSDFVRGMDVLKWSHGTI
jgi:predicted dehydrogenase